MKSCKSLMSILVIAVLTFGSAFAGNVLSKEVKDGINYKKDHLSIKEIRNISDQPAESNRDCTDCEFDFTAYGSECCDSAWDTWGGQYTCQDLEDDYGWDCSGCLCPGDASEIIRCTGSDWQSCIDDATCNSSIIVSSENQNSVLNINKNG